MELQSEFFIITKNGKDAIETHGNTPYGQILIANFSGGHHVNFNEIKLFWNNELNSNKEFYDSTQQLKFIVNNLDTIISTMITLGFIDFV